MSELEWIQEFGEKLRNLLDECGMTQEELADETGLHKATISRCIRGKYMPSVKTLINIGHALDCDVEDLIDFYERID